MATPTQRLGDLLLGGPGALRAFVRERRNNGISWRLITRELYEQHDFDISLEALRNWFPDDSGAAPEPADGEAQEAAS